MTENKEFMTVDKALSNAFSKIDDLSKTNPDLKDKIAKQRPKFRSSREENRFNLNLFTNYFSKKRKLSYGAWGDLIKANREKGEKRHLEFIKANNKEISETLLKMEDNYRKLLTHLNYTETQIDEAVQSWYDVVIKDDSPLMKY